MCAEFTEKHSKFEKMLAGVLKNHGRSNPWNDVPYFINIMNAYYPLNKGERWTNEQFDEGVIRLVNNEKCWNCTMLLMANYERMIDTDYFFNTLVELMYFDLGEIGEFREDELTKYSTILLVVLYHYDTDDDFEVMATTTWDAFLRSKSGDNEDDEEEDIFDYPDSESDIEIVPTESDIEIVPTESDPNSKSDNERLQRFFDVFKSPPKPCRELPAPKPQVPKPETVPDSSSQPETVPETVPDSQPETVPETVPDSSSQPETVPETQPETVPVQVPDSSSQPETVPQQDINVSKVITMAVDETSYMIFGDPIEYLKDMKNCEYTYHIYQEIMDKIKPEYRAVVEKAIDEAK